MVAGREPSASASAGRSTRNPGGIAIKNDFNEQWGKSHGYRAEIADAVQSDDLASVYWVGHCSSAESFGKAWETWRTELSDPKSVAAKLNERFEKCVTNRSRRGYDLY